MQTHLVFAFFAPECEFRGCGRQGGHGIIKEKGVGYVRLFVAIELPEPVRDALWAGVRHLEAGWTRGRLLPRESYHITLAFLGEQPEERLDDLIAVLDGCRCLPFRATVGGLGFFDQPGGGVLWREVRSPALYDLQGRLARGLVGAGFVLPDRPFQPHITLARRVVLPPGAGPDTLDGPQAHRSFPVEALALMRSRLSPQGASYQRLYQSSFA